LPHYAEVWLFAQAPFIGVTVGMCLAGILFTVAVFIYASQRKILVFIPRL